MFQELGFRPILGVLNRLKLIKRLQPKDTIRILENEPQLSSDEQLFKSEQSEDPVPEATIYHCYQIIQMTLKGFLNGYESGECCLVDTLETTAELRALICKVYPVKMRLEVLEAMFSLLFVRGKDLLETVVLGEEKPEEHDVDKFISSEEIPGYLSSVEIISSFDQAMKEFSTKETGLETQGTAVEKDNSGSFGEREEMVSPCFANAVCSTPETGSFEKGFLFREDAVKSFLELLNECVVELTADKFAEVDRCLKGKYNRSNNVKRLFICHLKEQSSPVFKPQPCPTTTLTPMLSFSIRSNLLLKKTLVE